MLPGTKQNVDRRLGMDVLEREYFGIFVHEFRWNFLASNFAEQAIVHGESSEFRVDRR
jgi:hypothetical protein